MILLSVFFDPWDEAVVQAQRCGLRQAKLGLKDRNFASEGQFEYLHFLFVPGTLGQSWICPTFVLYELLEYKMEFLCEALSD